MLLTVIIIVGKLDNGELNSSQAGLLSGSSEPFCTGFVQPVILLPLNTTLSIITTL